jgi:hypothetical protein
MARHRLTLEARVPDVLVRDSSDTALELLKDQARPRGRTLQAELKVILDQASRAADVAALAPGDQIGHGLTGEFDAGGGSGSPVSSERSELTMKKV